jgi:hypothetical protein
VANMDTPGPQLQPDPLQLLRPDAVPEAEPEAESESESESESEPRLGLEPGLERETQRIALGAANRETERGNKTKYKPGNRLSLDHREILEKLLQIEKLSNTEVAWVLNCDARTIRRRRLQFAQTGSIDIKKDVSMNAEKFKPHHLEVSQPRTVQ